MRPPRHTAKAVSIAATLAGLACVWFFFAPSALGGSTSYVVTDGISMEPRFHAGDLVVVRAQSEYKVGEIVAYRNRQLGTIVLHRIVGRDGSRYVFKGDNNNFIDFEHPARSQLIGALWIHLPGMGADLASVRSPALIGALFALGTLLLGGGAFVRRRRRRRRDRRGGDAGNTAPVPIRGRALSVGSTAAIAAVALSAITPFAALALLAFTRAPGAAVSVEIPYAQHGRLSYSAQPQAGPAYPASGLHTGDPIFTHVVGTVELGYSYRFSSHERHSVSGSASLAAEVSSTSGWKTTIPLGAPASFRGDSAHVSARLDVASLLALVSRVQAITGVHGSYTLTIVPQVRASGTIGGAPLRATFADGSRFSLNSLEIRPVTATGSSAETTEPAALFAKSAAGTATVHRNRPSQLSLGAFALPVELARTIALGGIALVVCALAAALALARPGRRRGETAEILSRYGSLIVPVERVWQMPGVAVIDVADIDALARIAAHYQRSILHEETEYGNAFWVSDESGQFRYAVWDESAWPETEPVEEVETAWTGEAFLSEPAPDSEWQQAGAFASGPGFEQAAVVEPAAVSEWERAASGGPALVAEWQHPADGEPAGVSEWQHTADGEPAAVSEWQCAASGEPAPDCAWEHAAGAQPAADGGPGYAANGEPAPDSGWGHPADEPSGSGWAYADGEPGPASGEETGGELAPAAEWEPASGSQPREPGQGGLSGETLRYGAVSPSATGS